MKAISLWQPWASLMAVGAKRNETRSWPTSHFGGLAICAAKHWDDDCHLSLQAREFQVALNPRYGGNTGRVQKWNLPFGMVVAVVDLCGCVPTSEIDFTQSDHPKDEIHFGNYSPGRFAWVTRNVKMLNQAVPVIGRQGLWNLPPETEVLIRAQLP